MKLLLIMKNFEKQISGIFKGYSIFITDSLFLHYRHSVTSWQYLRSGDGPVPGLHRPHTPGREGPGLSLWLLPSSHLGTRQDYQIVSGI